MALLAVHAAAKGKFWQMNDVLFGIVGETHEVNVKDIATRTGLDYPQLLRSTSDPKTLHQLKVDIWQGMKLRMTGTPSFLVDGKVYQGQIPPEILKKVLN
jgi:protein-disulfide isomerase